MMKKLAAVVFTLTIVCSIGFSTSVFAAVDEAVKSDAILTQDDVTAIEAEELTEEQPTTVSDEDSIATTNSLWSWWWE